MANDFDCNKCYHGKVCAYKMAFKDTIEACNEYKPTADVVEVKHGEWKSEWSVLANALYFNCSLCGEPDPWQGRGRGRAKYCPNCGAKMDGRSDT